MWRTRGDREHAERRNFAERNALVISIANSLKNSPIIDISCCHMALNFESYTYNDKRLEKKLNLTRFERMTARYQNWKNQQLESHALPLRHRSLNNLH